MSAPIHVLELRSVRGTGGGPEKTILLGAALSDPRRVRATVCYIRDRRDDRFEIDRRAESLGVDYVEIIERHSADPSIWWALRALIRERSIQIVHSHDYKTNLLGLLAARAEGIAALSTVHGWTGNSFRERWFYYPFDKLVLARFPRAIAVSGDIGRVLRAAGARPDRVRTVLNGIDHHAHQRDRDRQSIVRAALDLAPEDVVIGTVGRLERQKRFDLLLEAFALARRQNSSLRLVVVGDGSLRSQLLQKAVQCGVDRACRFLGQRADIADLHHAFDVFVQSSDYEGSANAVLEAMAMETPVVATRAGGTAELVEDDVHGILVEPGDARVLADAIHRVCADPGASRRRAIAARVRIERELSFDARMAAVERIYEELIAEHRVSRNRLRWARA
jgi:glycosyltransferase involved in cell wall biosynthesis